MKWKMVENFNILYMKYIYTFCHESYYTYILLIIHYFIHLHFFNYFYGVLVYYCTVKVL